MNITPRQYCVFDVETPNKSNDRICSLSLVVLRDGLIVDARDYLVNPETTFDAYNTHLTGISAGDVIGMPTFPQVWDEISDLFYRSVVVAHNARFDMAVLNKCIHAYGIPTHDLWYTCTLKCTKQLMPELGCHKLPAICEHLGISLAHHKAGSDARACAAILQHLLHLDPAAVEESVCSYDMPEVIISPSGARKTVKLTETTQAIHDLRLIVSALVADNQLTDGEVDFLNRWVQQHHHLYGHYPYDKILHTLDGALADDILEQQELDELLLVLKETLDPVKEACTCPADQALTVAGKNLLLTGDFESISRSQLEKQLAEMGAVVQKGVTRKTDYLIVGGKGSAAWSSGNYGNKVKKALELQEKGFCVQIIREPDFLAAIKKDGACNE